MRRATRLFRTIAGAPILWGGLASAGFYELIRNGVLSGQFFHRYFTSHPVEYVATTMFFIGLAVLVRKLLGLLVEYPTLSKPLLGPAPRTGTVAEDCCVLLERLARLPAHRQGTWLVQRIREALEHVRRRGTAESLDDQLIYLADRDAARQYASFALVRVIIWAIPMLGFLGTVIGITLAIANLVPGALEDSQSAVVAGLGMAFDTTALGLGLSIVLMFAQFLIDRMETVVLAEVQCRVAAELEDSIEQEFPETDSELAAVRRMGETVVAATEGLVHRQAELWRDSIDIAAVRWTQMAEAAGEQLQTALSGALVESLRIHRRQLAATEHTMSEEHRRHWQQVQEMQNQGAEALASLQAAMTAQASILSRAVEAAGDVAKLEAALNRNLNTLAGAQHFEQTVMSLAAAIHLLNARLSDKSDVLSAIQLQTPEGESQAA